MPRGLKVSSPLIANMIIFVNIHNSCRSNNVYIITFDVPYWVVLEDILPFWYAKEEEIHELINVKRHLCKL